MRTGQGASNLPAATVATTLVGYAVLYSILVAAFVIFARRLLRQGPDTAHVPGPLSVRAFGVGDYQ
jgi:cytochrome d ubiquinol oxidase subunit I